MKTSAQRELKLRRALETLTREFTGDDVAAQIPAMRQLASESHHSITLVEAVASATPGRGQSNCYMHALGMRDAPSTVLEIPRRFGHVYPGTEFVTWLLNTVLVARSGEPVDGDIVLYFEGPELKHAGTWKGGLVVSKWGIGHVWMHRPFEVPVSYGQSLKTFHGLESGVAAERFLAYAQIKLGPAVIAALPQPRG